MKFLVSILFLMIGGILIGQDTVVDWSMESVNDTIIVKANVKEGWRIYASDLDPSIGPVPTTFYSKSDSCSTGQWIEPKSKEKFDETFQAQVSYWSGDLIFKNYSECKTDQTFIIDVEYMACNHETCLPPEVITLKSK